MIFSFDKSQIINIVPKSKLFMEPVSNNARKNRRSFVHFEF